MNLSNQVKLSIHFAYTLSKHLCRQSKSLSTKTSYKKYYPKQSFNIHMYHSKMYYTVHPLRDD